MYEFLKLPISKEEFVSQSKYRGKFKPGELIRDFISALFNDPSKAMVFLALSFQNFGEASQIRKEL